MTQKQKANYVNKINSEIEKARRRIERYDKGIAKGEHGRFDAIESLKNTLEQYEEKGYLTKSGAIRKNISNKSLELIKPKMSSTLLNKESAYHRVKTVKARTQSTPHVAYNLAELWGVDVRTAKKYIKTITELQNNALMDKLGFSSTQVEQLIETYTQITPDTLRKVAEYLIEDSKKSMPEFMSKYKRKDDFTRAMIDILEKVDNLPQELKNAPLDEILREKGL